METSTQELVNTLTNVINNTSNYVSETTPKIVSEILLYSAVDNAIVAIFCGVLLAFSAKLGMKFGRRFNELEKDYKTRGEPESIGNAIGSICMLLVFLFAFCGFVDSQRTLLQIALSPHMFLIRYVTGK